MIRPDFRYVVHSNELYHYGMPRRSGRYPWGSGKRPYQDKKINKNVMDEIRKIHSELSEKDKFFVGDKSISQYTKYVDAKDGAYIVLDDYKNKFKNEHPYDGLIVSIAASPRARGKKITDKLIEDAKNNADKRLIAEIDSDNTHSKNLFERNGFKLMDSFDDIDFYYWDKKIKHSSESEVNFKMNDFYYLSHGGPGSGRYPLGSGDRPYQKFEKSRSRGSGISGYIRSVKTKKAEAQQQKQKAEDAKRRAEAAERKRQHDADRERVLREGSASEVLKYRGELTNKELQDAYNRIDWERKLSSFSADEIKTGMQKIDKAMSNLKTINLWGSTLTDSYNLLASVYNATSEGKKNPWPEIRRSGGGKK